MHFTEITASDLILIDANDKNTMSQPNAPDPTAWAIHSALHRNNPQARCILHVHPQYATILSSLDDKEMKPIDQNTMRFYDRVSIDRDFSGMDTMVTPSFMSNTRQKSFDSVGLL